MKDSLFYLSDINEIVEAIYEIEGIDILEEIIKFTNKEINKEVINMIYNSNNDIKNEKDSW